MIYLIRNKKGDSQQVMFLDGTSKIIQPGQTYELDINLIYRDEFERLKRFFDVNPVTQSPEFTKPERIVKRIGGLRKKGDRKILNMEVS